MFALNYLYFLIITMLLLQYLQRRSKRVKHPLLQREILTFSGPDAALLHGLTRFLCASRSGFDGAAFADAGNILPDVPFLC